MLDKNQIREQLKEKFKTELADPFDNFKKDKQLAALLANFLHEQFEAHCTFFKNKKALRIGAFSACDWEPNWSGLNGNNKEDIKFIDEFNTDAIEWLSPRRVYRKGVAKKSSNEMDFTQIKLSELIRLSSQKSLNIENYFFGETSDGDLSTTLPDIIFVPGMAFSSKNGARLGRGRGFYDRYLSTHPINTRVGICYECQLMDELPVEKNDQFVNIIITEKKIYKIS